MKSLQILVVEDEAVIASLLGEVLRGMGHEVCATEGAERDAIAAALRLSPDLIIVDEHLGDGSGLAVIEAVLGNGPVPHVFVTGDAMRIKRLRPDSVVLEKPYREIDLARAMQRAMLGAPAAPARDLAPASGLDFVARPMGGQVTEGL